MPATILDQVLSHLEFLGYEIEHKEGFAAARHPRRYNMAVSEYAWGVLFRVYFGSSAEAERDKCAVYEAVNAFNLAAAVCRCYLDKDFDFAFEAVYPRVYDKVVFGTFIDAISDDLAKLDKPEVNLSRFIS